MSSNERDEWDLDGEQPELEEVLKPAPWRGNKEIYKLVERLIERSNENKRPKLTPVTRRSVCYAHGRREQLLRRLGYPVLFYPRELHHRRHKMERVHLYIDVSASMLHDSILQFIFGLTIHLQEYIGERLFQFTTMVRGVSVEDIKAGRLLSGGTEIDAVIQHALQNEFERIMIITDGGFEEVSDGLARRAKRAGLWAGVLLTERFNPSWFDAELFELLSIHEELNRESLEAPMWGPRGRGRGRGRDKGADTTKGGAVATPMIFPEHISLGC